jgi:hypothetical protein
MALFAGVDANRLYRPSLSHSELHTAGTTRDKRANPLLLLLRLTLESAFKDLQHVKHGSPAPEALAAAEWIRASLDWTRRDCLPPPEELRPQYYFSYEWTCQQLNVDPERTRMEGLRHIHGLGRCTERWLPGLPEVYERWRQAREQYEAQHTEPLEQQQEAMAASV